MQPITVNTKFDAGSIEIVDISSNNLQFKIRHDTNSQFKQWFYFELNNVKNQLLKISIIELKDSAYPKGFENYKIVASYDRQNWFRIPTTFDGDILQFEVSPKSDSIFFAYFEPYSFERHLNLIAMANTSLNVTHKILGYTFDKRSIDMLTIGDSNKKLKIWMIARQHPGETMAEWFMEGVIQELLNTDNLITKNLLEHCVFYLVPNMNPDGAYHGNLRTNLTGTNLNREWVNPSMEKSPEVLLVQSMMHAVGVNMFFDIHGDESIPYVFLAGCEENPSFSEYQKKVSQLFQEHLLAVAPDFQVEHGYVRGHFSSELASIATSWVGDQFNCLSYTLEMPFKDNDNNPDELCGWNGKRSMFFGKCFLNAINLIIRDI